jgi:hypothetical protein
MVLKHIDCQFVHVLALQLVEPKRLWDIIVWGSLSRHLRLDEGRLLVSRKHQGLLAHLRAVSRLAVASTAMLDGQDLCSCF